MTNANLKYDTGLYEVRDCQILRDLTPKRRIIDKIYLCKCNICGKTFTRCRKTLVFHHSDCGCAKHNNFRAGLYTDTLISDMDTLSKKVMLAKLNAMGNPDLGDVFQALYIEEKSYSEYTALSLGMSMATLYRARKRIHRLWSELKNDLMEK